MQLRLAVVFCALGLVFGQSPQVRATSQQQKLLRSRQLGTQNQILSRILTPEYDPKSRPPVRQTANHPAIVVISSIYLNRVDWNADDTADVDLYLRQQYEDSRLSYDVDPRERIDEIALPADKTIWTPDTYVVNADETTPANQLRSRTIVEPGGFVRRSEQRQISVPVEQSGPFATRRSFHIVLSSYAYSIDDIVYLWANSPPLVVPVEVSKSLLDGRVPFVEAYAGDCVGNYTVGVHSCIDVTVTFASTPCDALLRVYIPALLLVIASWLHFFIHGSWSVPRTASAALPFFILASYHVAGTPASLTQAARLWLAAGLVFTFASLVEYFIVIGCGVHRRVTTSTTTSPAAPGQYTALHSNEPLHAVQTTVVSNQPIDNEVYEKTTRCSSFAARNGIDTVSRILFPVAFFIFVVVFVVLYVI